MVDPLLAEPNPPGVAVTRRLVPFRGEGAGTGDLSWGQRELWGGMVQQKSWFPIGVTEPLPAGATVDDLAAQLAFMVSRHQSMRTRLRFTSDGRPRQVVFPAGEIPLGIVDAGHGDPAVVAAHVEQRFRDTDFDFTADWPVRMAIVCRHGRPTHRITIMCHLVTDGFGAAVLSADLTGRDRVAGAARSPVTGMAPLAQARWQSSPAGRKQNHQALRYWERLLRTIPARRFRGSDDPREPRFWQAKLHSPAMRLASEVVAARIGADTSTVLLTAYAVALGRITGAELAVTRVLVSNRFRAGLADVVAPVSQPALCALDVSEADFDQLVARTRRQTMAAYKCAYYDTFQLHTLILRVGDERRDPLDIACFFNDRRMPEQRELPDRLPDPAAPRAALARTRFEWGETRDRAERLFLHLDAPPGAISISLWADTHQLAPADIEKFLLTMEAVLVDAAAAGPGPP